MKFTILLVFVIACVLAAHLSEVGGVKMKEKICTKPKGNDGESWTEGCLKQTCKNGVWRSSMDESLCCFDREAFPPNHNILTTTSQDGCTTTSIDCRLDGDKARMVFHVENSCPKPATENQVEALKQLLKQHITGHKTCCCQPDTSTTMTDSTTTMTATKATATPSTATPSTSTTFTATPSTVPTTTTTPATEGIFIAGGLAGGYGEYNYTELFIPHTGKSCSLPDLPASRGGHTMDTLGNTPVLCGGRDDYTSCLHFTPNSASGVWTNYATMLEGRIGHTSWVSSAGLVMMGGSGADTTASSTTEIVPSGGGNFSLVQNTRLACAIADKDSTIITGGMDTMKVVSRYNLQGHVENLPQMTQGRMLHGCGSYHSGGTMVRVVAGGQNDDYNYLSSTEQLTMGGTAWTTAKSLPRKLYLMATVSMNNQIYILGGWDGDYNERAEIMAFDGEDWKEVGQLQKARAGHAATKIVTTDINCD